MPERTVIPTGLSVKEAIPVLEQAMASYRERFAKYHPEFAWLDSHRGKFGFRALGSKVEGQLAVRDGEVEVTLDVPFLLRPFRQRALATIDAEVTRWVAKAKGPKE
jgi:hypothetical protein